MKVVVLGSGTSHGVPMIGCSCAVCTSADPRDRRTRCSIVVSEGETSVLVDTPPELRLQCLSCGVERIDAVLLTHHHADHLAGFDDLRHFNRLTGRAVPVYGMAETLEALRAMFRYVFSEDREYESYRPAVELRAIEGPVTVGRLTAIPVPLLHGRMRVLGYRFGRFAYCTDVSAIPEESYGLLEGLEVLILDALRRRPHPTHFNLEQAVEQARRIGARRTFFTHIAHELGHAETCAALPAGMSLAYDGQVIEVV